MDDNTYRFLIIFYNKEQVERNIFTEVTIRDWNCQIYLPFESDKSSRQGAHCDLILPYRWKHKGISDMHFTTFLRIIAYKITFLLPFHLSKSKHI